MQKLILLFFTVSLLFFSCKGQNNTVENKLDTINTDKTKGKTTCKPQHPLGGWYCPDNILGFPPINIKELDKISVVQDRLPTKKETRSGKSLMYIDKTEYPTAKPLDIPLPQLAHYKCRFSKKNELIIVIQAVVFENDTIVGFRYVNGGNGSDWISEVKFISEEDSKKLNSTNFVNITLQIDAPKEKIWNVITSPDYAKELGVAFGKGAYMESNWKENSYVHFKYTPDSIVSTGVVTMNWENVYIQIDYDFFGYSYVEKFLLLDNEKNESKEFHVVAGPYGADFEDQKIIWSNWLKKVKKLSEIP